MSEEQTENEPDVEIKEELYMLYLEIKEEITSKNISLEKDQIIEAVSSININTIIEYIREMVYILINIKIPKKEENNLIKRTKEQTQNELYQMESHIRKLENDIKFLIQKEFQNKIKRDTLEMKVNSYMEMENEFEELKEKVKYQGGEFLNNERKDNEIIILRQENGILKKEIEKEEKKVEEKKPEPPKPKVEKQKIQIVIKKPPRKSAEIKPKNIMKFKKGELPPIKRKSRVYEKKDMSPPKVNLEKKNNFKKPKPKEPFLDNSKNTTLFDKCPHFYGNYLPKFACCNKFYGCYLCHNEKEDHIYRFSNKVACLFCKTVYAGKNCPKCRANQLFQRKML